MLARDFTQGVWDQGVKRAVRLIHSYSQGHPEVALLLLQITHYSSIETGSSRMQRLPQSTSSALLIFH